jgi:hypothetical protein
MKERGILMSAPMVRATLREVDPKTQTRRIVKVGHVARVVNACGASRAEMRDHRALPANLSHSDLADASLLALCPYGQPGDRLWVRETFGHFERNDQLKPGAEIFYRADGECLELEPWRPSIHMPRWASRITLEITGARIERLQAIDDADAQAEGAEPRQPLLASGIVIPGQHRLGFRDLWNSINGDDAWDANPCVWVVEFKRVQP